MKKLLWLGVFFMTSAVASIEVREFKNTDDEARYAALIHEFRCPKCQNQNLAGSDAPIAVDLKNKTYDLINEGKSDDEIKAYMRARYGDYISYKPPVRPSTWVLWFFPPFLLLALILGWVFYTKMRPKGRRVAPWSKDEERAWQALDKD